MSLSLLKVSPVVSALKPSGTDILFSVEQTSASGHLWGGITGTLADQTDLGYALDAKRTIGADLDIAGHTISDNAGNLELARAGTVKVSIQSSKIRFSTDIVPNGAQDVGYASIPWVDGHFSGTGYFGTSLEVGTGNDGGSITAESYLMRIRAKTGASMILQNSAATHFTTFQNNNSDVMLRIKEDDVILQQDGVGNVGIGTNSPSAKLEVVGSIVARETDDGADAVKLLAGASSGAVEIYSGGGLKTRFPAANVSYIDNDNYFIVNDTSSTSIDPIIIAGGSGATTGNSHGFVHDTGYTKTVTGDSINSFDAFPIINGAAEMGHYAAFQSRPNVNGTLTLDRLAGFQDLPTNNSGTVITLRHGIEIREVLGAGTVGTNIGVYVEALTGTTDAWAVYTAGTTKSYFGGNVGIGTATPATALNIDKGFGIANGLTFGDGDTGWAESSADSLSAYVGSVRQMQILSASIRNTNANSAFNINTAAATATLPSYAFYLDIATGLGSAAAGTASLIADGVNVLNALPSGNVGIGTATPTEKLEVAGNIQLSAIYPQIQLIDLQPGGSTFKLWNLGNQFRVGTNAGTSSLASWYAKSGDKGDCIFNGNVGIGTTSPSAKLSVKAGTSGTEDKVFEVVSNDGRELSILQPDNGNYSDAWTFFTNNAYTFRVDAIDALNIDSSGNVGIGTTSPSYKLDVDGDARLNGLFVNSTTAKITGDGGQIYMERSGTINVAMGNAGLGVHPSRVVGWSAVTATSSLDTSLSRISAGVMGVGTGTQGETDGTLIAGKLGIGTTSPSAKLEVASGTGNQLRIAYNSTYYWDIERESTTGRLSFTDGATGGERLTVLTDGNVGIGTASPADNLEIRHATEHSPARLTIHTNSNTSSKYAALMFKVVGANTADQYRKAGLFFENTGTGSGRGTLHFCVDSIADSNNVGLSDSKMVIDSTGNVGIGTTSPTSSLQIGSSGQIRMFDTWSDPLIELDGYYYDNPYFNFKSYNAAPSSTTEPISGYTVSGATTHHIQVKLNGVKAWIAVSTNAPSAAA